MYVVLLLGLLGVGASAVVVGQTRGRLPLTLLGGAVLVATLAFFASLSLWGEYLWFEQLGFGERWLTQVLATGGTALAGAAVVGGVAALATGPLARETPGLRAGVIAAGLALGGLAGAGSWDVALRWLHRVPTGTVDPVLGLDLGFHLFTLPFVELIHGGLLLGSILALGAALWASGSRTGPERPSLEPPRMVQTALGALALVLAAGRVLAVPHLLVADHGLVHGADWTDVHVRMPALLLTAAALAAAGAALLVPAPRRALEGWFERMSGDPGGSRAAAAVAPLAAAGTIWALGVGLFPEVVHAVVVTPNEQALEEPYARHALAATRRAWGLDRVEERTFAAGATLSPGVLDANRELLGEVPLWDARALDPAIGELQELRPYYAITDLDVDRYRLGGRWHQVVVGARELDLRALPPASRTFVNRHFKYTHGYGVAIAPLGDPGDGLPRPLLGDLPPTSAYRELELTRPEVYFGEHTDEFVVVNGRDAEFDHPAENGNAYTRYEGTGGVALDSVWRRFVYGWKLGGTSLWLSAWADEGSRLMFRRNVRDRVAAVAPFLRIDRDPYPVVADGRIAWIVDAYTTSSRYPYSEPVDDGPAAIEAHAGTTPWGAPYGRWPSAVAGANYVRNAVKVVVDAYDGTVDLYVVDPTDPLVRAWVSAFPDLFRPATEMPDAIRAHVSWPEALLKAQAQVYGRYRATDPVAFLDQADRWTHPTEERDGARRPVEPTTIPWRAPGSSGAGLALVQPFAAEGRPGIVGWLAALSDGQDYGRLVAVRLPAGRVAPGPSEVNAAIDQDPRLSAQLAAWDRAGARIVRGGVLPLPVGDTLLAVEPIYVQAATAPVPELRVVVVMHGDDLSFAPTFDDALAGLASGRARASALDLDAETLWRAREAYDAYVRSMGEERFEDAARELRTLGQALGSR